MLALAPGPDHIPPRLEARSLDEVFEVLTRAVFQAGLHWAVVDRRWAAFEQALEGFDPHAVAAYGPPDVDRLAMDRGLVRNRAKLEATVANARALVEIERDHGSFGAWLAEHDGHEAACAALRSRFSRLGEFGATWALWVLGGPAPPYVEWSRLAGVG